jgi:DNA-binding MarR family transcriptional regulator
MTEQFGAIPVRAFGDARLSAADFRVMGVIAYFDRLGRNGTGCYVDPRKLAELAAVDYKHVARHTGRLQEFGYLEIGRSATDRRKRFYSLIYNEDRAVVANSGDNLDAGAKGAGSAPLNDENIISTGENPPEKVTKSKSQIVDPQAKPAPKRLSEAYLRDPAKPCVRNGKNAARFDLEKPNHIARQWVSGGGNGRVQKHMMLPNQRNTQTLQEKSGELDWNGWATRLQQYLGMTSEAAWLWLMDMLTRIAVEQRIDPTAAGAILDRELRKRRALQRDKLQNITAVLDRASAKPTNRAILPSSPANQDRLRANWKPSAPPPLGQLPRSSQRAIVKQL